MRRRVVIAALASLVAVAAFAQKGPLDELGFHPEKLYDFNAIDTVNLFNGNLTLSIPLGVRYSVSSHLSYQFNLVYNGKVWDYVTYNSVCQVGGSSGPCPPKKEPNLRSNAGLGWRLSLGRLLPPYQSTTAGSLRRDPWMYESPAGDEHFFFTSNADGSVQVNVPAGLRMIEIDDNTRDVEFASGEIHRFLYESGDWRLTQMRDRFGNAVNIVYTFASDGGETHWAITDTVGRHHDIDLIDYEPTMSDGWARGHMVTAAHLEGPGGGSNNRANYGFAYQPRDYWGQGCESGDGLGGVPMLLAVTLPDSSAYQFAYAATNTCVDGELYKMTYPTGGSVTYSHAWNYYPDSLNLCSELNNFRAIASRTVDDGTGPAEWDYIYNTGSFVPVTYVKPVDGVPEPDNDPCQKGYPDSSSLNGPVYWGRTSVLTPVINGLRNRTDHYFNTFTDQTSGGWCRITNPFPSGSGGLYGYSGPSGVPPPGDRSGLPHKSFLYVGDVASSSVGGGLATEAFEACTSAGDCTNAKVLRRSYDTYDPPLSDSSQYQPTAQTLTRTRTEYTDDTSCSPTCYAQTTKSDRNGFNQYRTTTIETNFPAMTTSATTTQFPDWSWNDLVDLSRLWVAQRYTETTRTEASVTAHETFCFDNATTGLLQRHRVLAGSAPAPNDVLQVFAYDTHGDLQYSSDYGGDAQPIDTGTDVCAISIPSQPVYKIETDYMTIENGASVYTGGIPATSKYLDRTTGLPLTFLSLDRTIDRWTGAVTASRDPSGAATTFTYDHSPARLISISTAAGVTTSYAYTNATTAAPARVHATTTAQSATIAESDWTFDGLGRVLRAAALGPAATWSATETKYDPEGRVASKSEPESTGSTAPTGSLQALYRTSYSYDALGRTKSVTAPDASSVSFAYVGAASTTRTSSVGTGGASDTAVRTVEKYDGFARLISVDEWSGPTSATAPTGGDVLTSYAYDIGSRLTTVKMGSATQSGALTGAVQTRIFDYDGRGFLRWESQPESGMVSYTYDARGHVLGRTQSAASSPFDLNYTYDSAERLLRIDGRNPFYGTGQEPPFHAIKDFTYATDNGTFVRQQMTLTDLSRGKVATATRHNYGQSTLEPVYDVQDTYHYGDTAGRKTDRTTTISRTQYGATNVVQSVTTSVVYNALDRPTSIIYPMCDGCGTPPTDPDRSLMSRTYDAGRLTMLSNFITGTTYWPNGMRNVLHHANGIDDTQTISNMPRPSQIGFGTTTNPYDRCVRPTFTLNPASATLSGTSATLTASVSGTGPFTYTWYASSQNDPIATHANVTATTDTVAVSPTATTTYNVIVSNPCGYESSESALVEVNPNPCSAPTTGTIKAVLQPDGSWILTPSPTARQPRTCSWKRLSDNAILGSSETLAIGALSTTTSYQLTITDSCGTGTGQVTVSVPLPMTIGLQATTATPFTQIQLTWPAISGATSYTIERRSAGGAWQWAGSSQTNGFTDTNGIALATTYVYRVTSNNGGHTDYDVATTRAFTQAAQLAVITTAPMNDMLAAVNSVRAAAGWPAVSWASILAATDPVPDPGAIVTARQVLACRERMDEALQALGVAVRPYSDADVLRLTIKANYINEVEGRAQ